jgi:hypothetical protein
VRDGIPISQVLASEREIEGTVNLVYPGMERRLHGRNEVRTALNPCEFVMSVNASETDSSRVVPRSSGLGLAECCACNIGSRQGNDIVSEMHRDVRESEISVHQNADKKVIVMLLSQKLRSHPICEQFDHHCICDNFHQAIFGQFQSNFDYIFTSPILSMMSSMK